MTTSRVLASVSEEYRTAAIDELRGVVGPRADVEVLGPDLVAVEAPGLTAEQIAEDVRTRPLFFVKHLTGEIGRFRPAEVPDVEAAAAVVAPLVVDVMPRGERGFALHAWVSGQSRWAYAPAALARELTATFRTGGMTVAPTGWDLVVSVVLVDGKLVVGLSDTGASLVAWPGGRVRLAKGKDQVSRSEFKLEELVKTGGIDLPTAGRALDLGASPGGWTRILRAHGMTVTAVDPAELDPRLDSDRGITHRQTTSAEFFRGNDETFDLVVNDMRMEPARSADLMVEAGNHLANKGMAVMTVKLGGGPPERAVASALDRFRKRYDVVFARQLHHNRHEVTVVGRRR